MGGLTEETNSARILGGRGRMRLNAGWKNRAHVSGLVEVTYFSLCARHFSTERSTECERIDGSRRSHRKLSGIFNFLFSEDVDDFCYVFLYRC